MDKVNKKAPIQNFSLISKNFVHALATPMSIIKLQIENLEDDLENNDFEPKDLKKLIQTCNKAILKYQHIIDKYKVLHTKYPSKIDYPLMDIVNEIIDYFQIDFELNNITTERITSDILLEQPTEFFHALLEIFSNDISELSNDSVKFDISSSRFIIKTNNEEFSIDF